MKPLQQMPNPFKALIRTLHTKVRVEGEDDIEGLGGSAGAYGVGGGSSYIKNIDMKLTQQTPNSHEPSLVRTVELCSPRLGAIPPVLFSGCGQAYIGY